jgi:hypothetical protein
LANAAAIAPIVSLERCVHGLAASAWQYTERGLNRFGQHGSWLTTHEVNNLIGEPNTLLLLTFLKANNGPSADDLGQRRPFVHSKVILCNGIGQGQIGASSILARGIDRDQHRLPGWGTDWPL